MSHFDKVFYQFVKSRSDFVIFVPLPIFYRILMTTLPSGESVCRLLEFLGHDVLRLNHVGDWGTQA
jgi:hypothetical protein